MSRERPIRGACSCGRNRYLVEVPPNSDDGDVAQVLFETRSDHRQLFVPFIPISIVLYFNLPLPLLSVFTLISFSLLCPTRVSSVPFPQI